MTENSSSFRNLIIMLLETIADAGGDLRLTGAQMRDLANEAGFSEEDAADLAAWLSASGLTGPDLGIETNFLDGDLGDGVRILADVERDFLDPRVFGYLLSLESSRQITAHQREDILHFLSHAALEPLGLEDVDEIVDQVLLRRVEDQGLVFPPADSGLRH